MPVHIGELTTEVIAEGEPAAVPPAIPIADAAAQVSAVRAELAAIARDAARTSAEGFDD